MSSDLFRQEVLDARRQSWLGKTQASQPFSIRVVGWLTLVFSVAIIFYVYFGVYTRRVHATGYMAPPSGLITINAATTGLIVSQNAQEGQHLKKGDTIFILDTESSSVSGPTQEHILSQLYQQKKILAEQKELRIKDGPVEKESMVAQVRYLTQQHKHIEHQLQNDAWVLPIVEGAVRRMQAAESTHLVTQTQFQSQLYTYAQLLNSHAQFLQNYTDTESKISDLTTKLIRYDNQMTHDLVEFDKKISEIDARIYESESHRRIVIKAPDDGILSAVRVNQGQLVQAGQPLVTLLPTGHTLVAVLYVNSSSIGFLQKQEPVLLRYAAYPYQRFGLYKGRVSEITRAPVSIETTAQRQQSIGVQGGGDKKGNENQDIYRIRVLPDQQYVKGDSSNLPLQAGMAVDADIAIDTRRLYQWILGPAISVHDNFYAISGGLIR